MATRRTKRGNSRRMEVGRNGQKRSAKSVGEGRGNRNLSQDIEPRTCRCGCQETFWVTVKSRQHYVRSSHRKRALVIKKEALAQALATWFDSRGCRARDMLAVTRKCVEAEYEALQTAVSRLGWRYEERDKAWRFE